MLYKALFSRNGGGPGAPWRGFFATLAPRCTTSESVAALPVGAGAPPAASKTHSFCPSLFRCPSGSISNGFWTYFPTQVPPKTFQNLPKFDAKKHNILGFKFWSIFLIDFFLILQSSEGLERLSGTINIVVLWLLPLSLRNVQIIKISSQMRSKKQHLPIQKSIFSIQVSIFKGINNSSDVGIDFCAI